MSTVLYYGGNIITMNDEIMTAEAVLTENGIIKDMGNFDILMKSITPDTEMVDLNGATMLPSFIDSHGHFSGYANSLLNVSLENCKSFDDIESEIKKFISENNIKKGEWVKAEGYDHERLKEHAHFKRDILDRAAPDNPVAAVHVSNHSGVFNSAALKILNVDKNTVSPDGGIIEKVGGEPTGYMEENAFIKYFGMLPPPDIEKLMDAYISVQDLYASYGITTVQEGMFAKQLVPIYKNILNRDILKLDIVGYVDIDDAEKIKTEFRNNIKEYYRNFKIDGYKIFLDGSPQSKTAWLIGKYTDGTSGYGTLSNEKLLYDVKKAVDDNMQLLAHCNGDMASQQYISAWDGVNGDKEDTRPVMIHSQLLRPDQLDKLKELGITPSFFIGHIYYWGDIHIKNLGRKRAEKISCAGSALEKGILFTFHQDTPVTKPNMLETIWCAAARKTMNGEELGKEERISVYEALKAVTINAAWQYHEEDRKGSIEKGKRADFVLLDKDPLKVPLNELRDIQVLQTIKNGEIIFRK